MSKFKALFVSLVFLLIICLGGAFIVPSFVDWNKYKQPIQNVVSDKLGYEAMILGDLSFDVLPYPRLVLGETEVFTNKSKDQRLVSFDTLYVSVKLLPLLSKKVQVDKVSIIKPSINIIKDEYDQFNFMTETVQEMTGANRSDLDATKSRDLSEQKAAVDLGAISIDSLEIEDGSLVYQDVKAKSDYKVENFTSVFKAQTLSGPFDMKGRFDFQGETFDVSFRSERLTKEADSLPVQIDVVLEKAATKLKYSGLVSVQQPLEIQGEFEVSSSDLNKASTSFGGSAFTASALPLNIGGLVTLNSEGMQVDQVSGSIMDRDFKGDVEVSGLASDFNWNNARPPKFTLNIDVADLGDLSQLTAGQVATKSSPKSSQGESKKKAKDKLIPESLVLSKDLNFDVSVAVKSAQYNGQAVSGLKAHVKKAQGRIDLALNVAKIGAAGSAALEGQLKFLSDSRAGDSQVVYSDPVLKGDLNVKQFNLVPLLSNVDASQKPLMDELFKSFNVAGSYEVSPTRAKINDVNFVAGQLKGVGTVRYDLEKSGHDRPVVDLGLNMDELDVDRLLSFTQKDNPVPLELQKKTEKDLKEATKNFDLPFDVSGHIYVKDLRYMQHDLTDFQVKASLKDKVANIEGLSGHLKGNTEFLVSGKIEDVFKISPVDLSLDVKSKDIQSVLDLMKVDTTALQVPLRSGQVKGRVYGSLESLNFTTNVDVLETSIEASGVVNQAIKAPSVSALTVRVGHNDFEKFVQMFVAGYDAPIAARSKLDLYADLTSDNGKVFNLKQFKGQVGPYALDADALIDVSGRVPNVQGFIKGRNVVLSDFVNNGGAVSASASSSDKAKPSNKAGGDAKWSRTAINTAWMHSANIDMKFSFDRLAYDKWELEKLTGQAVLKDGVFDVYDVKSSLHGGSLALSGQMSSSANPREPVSVSFATKMSNVSFPGLVQSMGLPQVIRGEAGTVNFDLETSSTGLSPAALVFGLSGKGSLDGQNVVLRGFDLDKLARTTAKESSEFKQWKRLGQQAIKGVLKGGQTTFESMLGTFVIEEGVVKTNDLTMQSEKTIVRSTGHVNLPQWTVDMKTVIDILEPEDAPDLTYNYSGPLSNPVADMNAQNLLQYGISQAVDKLIEDKAGDIINKILKNPEASNDNVSGEGTQQAPRPEDVFKGILKDVISR